MLSTLYRTVDGEQRVIHGHLTRQEIAAYRQDGWHAQQPQINKHGIRQEGARTWNSANVAGKHLKR